MATLIRGDGRLVTAQYDAVAFNYAFTGKSGVLKDIGSECKLEAVGNIITVKSGMAVAQGRQVVFDGTDRISLPTYQGTPIRCRIYAELDMAATDSENKQGVITIKHIDSTSDTAPDVPASDNLSINPSGKANINLGSVAVESNGVFPSTRYYERPLLYARASLFGEKTGRIGDSKQIIINGQQVQAIVIPAPRQDKVRGVLLQLSSIDSTNPEVQTLHQQFTLFASDSSETGAYTETFLKEVLGRELEVLKIDVIFNGDEQYEEENKDRVVIMLKINDKFEPVKSFSMFYRLIY